jgi:hypothetical protein
MKCARNGVKLKKDQHSIQDRGSCGGDTYRHLVSWNFTDSGDIQMYEHKFEVVFHFRTVSIKHMAHIFLSTASTFMPTEITNAYLAAFDYGENFD